MRGYSILVVDDEPDVRRMVEVVFGGRGHSVLGAESGLKALVQGVEPRDKIRGLQEGAVDYLIKPFSVKEVMERIEVILEGPGAS